MADFVLRTVADELLELVRKSKKISVEEAARKLRMPIASVQALVDFLVADELDVFEPLWDATTVELPGHRNIVVFVDRRLTVVVTVDLDRDD